MAKSMYPYVIAWHVNPGRLEVMSRQRIWCSPWTVEMFMFYLSKSRAESDAFMMAASSSTVGDIAVYRLDAFVDVAANGAWVSTLQKMKHLQIGRAWMQKHRRAKRDRSVLR